ncbi:MAG: hypothetical protein V1743_01670 [Nanoarchaeota archaeon]
MNQTRSSIIVGLALFAVFILTSCQQQDPNRGSNLPFIGGSEGLTMDFAPGAPPDEVFDAAQFPFSVNIIIENVGEDDVLPDEAEIRLIGIEPGLFGVSDDDLITVLPQTLRGAVKLADGTERPGDITQVVFPTSDVAQLSYQPDLEGTDEIIMRAEMCYDYKTRSTTQVCIKDQLLENIYNDKICVVNEEKLPQNSGAPIHITELRETPQGKNNVNVQFKIEHLGGGLFFKLGTPCDDSITNPNENMVKIKVYFVEVPGYEAPPIKCPLFHGETEGYVNLFQGGPRTISCTIYGNPDKDRIYQDLLHIDLEYTYLNYIEKPLIIRDVTAR